MPFSTLLRIFCGYAPVWTAGSGDDMGGKSGVRSYTGGLEKHFVASMRRTELEPRAKLKRLYYSVRKSLALTDETRAKYTHKFDTYRKNNARERADQFRALLNEVGKDFGYPDLGTKLLSRKSIYRRDIKVIAKKAAQGIAEILLTERYRKEVEKYTRDYCVASETKQRIEPTNTCPYGTTNQSGWIWIEHRDNETWSTCDRLVEDEGKFIQGSIEFRIAVTPTKDNLAKAYAVLRSLANREDCPIHVMKMVDAEQLEKTTMPGGTSKEWRLPNMISVGRRYAVM